MKNYPLYPVECFDDFNTALMRLREKYGDAPAITVYDLLGAEHTHSFSEFTDDAEIFGEALMKAGYSGKHIAIASENCYEWMVALFGIAASGNVAVLVDVDQSVETINSMIARTDTVAAVASTTIAELISQGDGFPIIVIGGSGENNFASVCEHARPMLGRTEGMRSLKLSGDMTSVIAFTSGTTSIAKAVMLSHRALLHNSAGSLEMIYPGPKLFSSLPMFHTYGLTCSSLGPVLNGVNICVNGNLKTMLRDLKAFDPCTVMAVPLIAEMLCQRLSAAAISLGLHIELPKQRKRLYRFSQIQPQKELVALKNQALGQVYIIVSGGAHLAEQVMQKLALFGINVLQGYGITECSPLISANRPEANLIGSLGFPLPSLECRINENEIQVRGVSVMQGYYKDEAATAEVFTEDGWFCTGDLGQIDKDGIMYLIGRKKNLIVLKNGKKISPEEIEEHLSDIPLIKEVVAYGASAGASDDDVRLAITVFPNPDVTEGMSSYEILDGLQREIDKINLNYPSYKQIQMINLREREFAKTAAKKIKRNLI